MVPACRTLFYAGVACAALACQKPSQPLPPPACHVAFLQELTTRAKRMTPAQVTEVAAVLGRETARVRGDPLLVLALVDLESGFDAGVVSSRGARGLMQVMPGTAVEVAAQYGLVRPSGGEVEPAFDVILGMRYWGDLRDEFGSWERATLAYNLGAPGLRGLLRAHAGRVDLRAQPFMVQVAQRYRDLRRRYGSPAGAPVVWP